MTLINGQPTDVADFVGASATFLKFETTTGVTHSLTTVANQKVIVWAKGNLSSINSNGVTVTLKYNGVTKDTVQLGSNTIGTGTYLPFSLMYTETPGVATQNITVVTSEGSLANVVIIVCKLLVT